uniref:Uncharacterized protein n=1 Tax=Oryza barthii TaxID=65489 RepID=A0A0D3GN30_9ORYZ
MQSSRQYHSTPSICSSLAACATEHLFGDIAKNSGHMKKGSASAMMQQEKDAAESGVQSIGGDDLAPSPRLLFWGRIIRLSIITYASFKLGQNSARNAYKRTKAELPCLEAVDSTTA